MARNKITDLNDHLFAQLERLNDETIKPEKMALEIDKAKAISNVAGQIIKSNTLTLQIMKAVRNGDIGNDVPDSFGVKQLKAV